MSWVKGARCRQTPGVPLETPSAQKRCGEARPPAAISRVCWEEEPFRGCPRCSAWFRAGVGWVHQTRAENEVAVSLGSNLTARNLQHTPKCPNHSPAPHCTGCPSPHVPAPPPHHASQALGPPRWASPGLAGPTLQQALPVTPWVPSVGPAPARAGFRLHPLPTTGLSDMGVSACQAGFQLSEHHRRQL